MAAAPHRGARPGQRPRKRCVPTALVPSSTGRGRQSSAQGCEGRRAGGGFGDADRGTRRVPAGHRAERAQLGCGFSFSPPGPARRCGLRRQRVEGGKNKLFSRQPFQLLLSKLSNSPNKQRALARPQLAGQRGAGTARPAPCPPAEQAVLGHRLLPLSAGWAKGLRSPPRLCTPFRHHRKCHPAQGIFPGIPLRRWLVVTCPCRDGQPPWLGRGSLAPCLVPRRGASVPMPCVGVQGRVEGRAQRCCGQPARRALTHRPWVLQCNPRPRRWAQAAGAHSLRRTHVVQPHMGSGTSLHVPKQAVGPRSCQLEGCRR